MVLENSISTPERITGNSGGVEGCKSQILLRQNDNHAKLELLIFRYYQTSEK